MTSARGVADGWTIAEAVAEFAKAGMPVDPARFVWLIVAASL